MQQRPAQEFDNTLKALFGNEAKEILPRLIPEADVMLLTQALHAMKDHYTRRQFGHHFVRFKRIAQRSKTLSAQDKLLIEEEIRMHMAYDWFIDDNPDVQERVAKGKLQTLQQVVLDAINNRFPRLASVAQQQVNSIQNPEVLRH